MVAAEPCWHRSRLGSARPFVAARLAWALCQAQPQCRLFIIASLACCQDGACKAMYGPTQRASPQHAGRKAARGPFAGRGCAGAPSE